MKVRFAPSPTGNLHIGSVRTALFNWIFAKRYQAQFVLRIEDTDQTRSEKVYEENIFEGLKWLGLDMDEGPDLNTNNRLFRQSERIESGLYNSYVTQLIDAKKAYYCFETEAELEQERDDAKRRGVPYMYSGKSRDLSEEDVQKRLADGQPYAVRFHISETEPIVFQDQIRGEISFDPTLISDFVIYKSDGSPSYNFAVVVDDCDMGITHVIRGEDHISNTPKQILLYHALNKPVPTFAHLPIILGKDKSKLSKRDGAMAVTDYQKIGYLPEALINYLSLLGWSPPNGKEILNQDELIALFDVERISKSGAVFDEKKIEVDEWSVYSAVNVRCSTSCEHALSRGIGS